MTNHDSPLADQNSKQASNTPAPTPGEPSWSARVVVMLLLNLLMFWQPISLLIDLQHLNTRDIRITFGAVFFLLAALLDVCWALFLVRHSPSRIFSWLVGAAGALLLLAIAMQFIPANGATFKTLATLCCWVALTGASAILVVGLGQLMPRRRA